MNDVGFWLICGVGSLLVLSVTDFCVWAFHRIIDDAYESIALRKVCSPTIVDLVLIAFIVALGWLGLAVSLIILALAVMCFSMVALVAALQAMSEYSDRRGSLWSICQRGKDR